MFKTHFYIAFWMLVASNAPVYAQERPVVTSINPSSGPELRATLVRINGSNFQGGVTVTFGDMPATDVRRIRSSIVDAKTPAHPAGTVDVIVTNPDGQANTLENGFTFAVAPVVTSIDPTSGKEIGLTSVTITGSNFQSGATVTFSGRAATNVVVVSPTVITAMTPSHPPAGTVDVTVTNPDRGAGTLENGFTFPFVSAPVVTSIDPTSGKEIGLTSVTITGSNFQSGATVTVGGRSATNVVVVSPTVITATVPSHSAGTVDVTVTNPDRQSGTLEDGFTFPVFAAPVVTSIDPTSGKEIGLTSVTITGSNFQSGATVTVGGRAPSNVVVVSPTVITATVPSHSAGTVDVIVTNPDGLSGTLEDGFTFPVFAAPVVTSINSTSGPRRGGRPVTIEGSNFQSGATLVFGGSSATTVVVESPTVISAMTPSRRDGTVDVTIRNPDGQAGTLEDGYTFSDAQELAVRELRQVFAANLFVEPVLLTHAGDGSDRIFVVELAGRIKVMPNRDDAVATDFVDIRDRVTYRENSSGLLSVTFHPEHRTNGLFYVFYSRVDSGGSLYSRLSEFRVSTDPNVADVNSERVLLEVPQTGFQHNGDHLAFGPDGMLYMSQGTGGVPEQFLTAQDPTNLKGSMLRIDVDARSAGLEYGIPPDNPFVGNSQDWREEIWAYGLRNPWRFSFDRRSGLLWLGDVAWGLWEEIVIIEKGANYGWPTMGGSQCNSSLSRNTAIAGCDREGLTLPAFEYGHSDGTGASVTGGYVYRGARLSGLYGVYIYGDFVFKRIWGLRYEEGEVRSNDLIATSPAAIVSFGEDESGEVYIVGFDDGRIYAFEPLPGEMPTVVLSEESELPRAHALHQNYPNPFNPQTVIHYDLPVGDHVDVSIFNLMGQKVATLVDDHRSAGSYSLVWDGKDDNQKNLASGVYFYRMETDGFVQTRKMILTR